VLADPAAEEAYLKAFEAKYPPVKPVPTLAEYATVERYDKSFLGANLDAALEKLNNQGGAMAWGLSYRMVSLNEMARATRDSKYLAANLKCIRAALAVRDDRTGRKLFDGRIVPAWSSDGYRKGDQALFLVHTGMIVYPMLDAVDLARTLPNVPEWLRHDLEETVPASLESIAAHDAAWRDGPSEGEGYYAMIAEEPTVEGKPQPGNRLSAMGRALWSAHRVTKDVKYRNRALALGLYIKQRLTVTEDGAYIWPYWLPESAAIAATTKPASIAPEDTSHAGLTMSFPILLAAEGELFTKEDAARFAKTVSQGMTRLDSGVIWSDIGGGMNAAQIERLGYPANWLVLAPLAPDVRSRIVPFYLRHKSMPRPIEMAYLIRFGREESN
jgi:hypothetical protein